MLYWEGFEIDGSDTDFDLVLPEVQETVAFVDCFLALPIFQKKASIYYRKANFRDNIAVSKEELRSLLMGEDRPELTVEVNCLGMDQLQPEDQAKLFALSETREPREEAYGKVDAPAMVPVRQNYYTRGEMTVALTVHTADTKTDWRIWGEEELEGYIHNDELFHAGNDSSTCFSINMGPSFYYEYAMYIMEHLRERFPNLATAGGLDCAGGWTDGCTYANSIYMFEKIDLPVAYSVKNTLKRLTEVDLIRPFRQYYKRGWQFDYLDEFRMANIPKAQQGKEYLLGFGKYVEHVERTLEEQQTGGKTAADALYDTAAHVALPGLSRFEKKPHLQDRLRPLLSQLREPDNHWNYSSYLAFFEERGESVCQLRVFWQLKPYVMALLELAEAGELDYIKEEVYARRHGERLDGPHGKRETHGKR